MISSSASLAIVLVENSDSRLMLPRFACPPYTRDGERAPPFPPFAAPGEPGDPGRDPPLLGVVA